MDNTHKVAKLFLKKFKDNPPGPMLSAALNGKSDTYFANRAWQNLKNNGKKTVTMKEIREAMYK